MERLKIAVEAGVAGILSLLWWDIRKIRTLKVQFKKEIADEYISKDKHADVCKIACLEMKNYVSAVVSQSEQRIIQEVKKANGGLS